MSKLFKCVRQRIMGQLWYSYSASLQQVTKIQAVLWERYAQVFILDHLALIDLPGLYTGIDSLAELFSYLDYIIQGQGYLTEKQNDFMWLAEKSNREQRATTALPQVVVADFRRDALLPEILRIVDRYAVSAKPLPRQRLKFLKERVLKGDGMAALEFFSLIMNYLQGRDWPLPTVGEFETIRRYNELLAWVLVKGRQVNHFALAVHLLQEFRDLRDFNRWVSEVPGVLLNKKGDLIKGSAAKGIEQSATQAPVHSMRLSDGVIKLPDRFFEFVWRYPLSIKKRLPTLWRDYFTGFIADNANRVVESLYL